MSTRWDPLLAQNPVSLLSHLQEEVARLLAGELDRWPPPIQEVDTSTIGGLAAVLAPDAPPPHPAAWTEAFRLARWQLERAFDAYDDYLRNRRFLEAGVPPGDRPALLVLERWMVEQMLALGEATEGRFTRRHMGECLVKVEAHLAARRAAAAKA